MTVPTDLQDRLCALVESVAPVSAEEAIARAGGPPPSVAPVEGRTPSSGVVGARARRRGARPALVAASVLALAGAATGLAVAAGSTPPGTPSAGPPTRGTTHTPARTVLTAADVQAITSRSSAAAASSGTAQVTETSSQNGVPQDGYDLAVTFSGANIDEKITSVPEPPGSADAFTTDDRLVDGQFYMYTPGPGDVLEWLHDTNSADDVASMQFPDPRTLYGAISAGADFAVAGTATLDGTAVTRLVAGEPSAIDTAALGNLAEGATVTSFVVWVGADDVVQQLSLATSQVNRVCALRPLTAAQRKALLLKDGETVTLPDGTTERVIAKPAIATLAGADCGPVTTVTHVTVTFADLGVPQSVTVPQGARNVAAEG
jgi:hypothetical protein